MTIAEADERLCLLAPRDVIMFGFGSWPDWERLGFPRRNARCALRLLSDDRFRNVVLFNSPSTPLAAIRAAGSGGMRRRMGLLSSRPRTNLEVHNAVLPLRLQSRVSAFRRFNVAWASAWAARQARKAIARMKPSSVIVWVANPVLAPIAAEIEEADLLVFDAIDNWIEHPQLAFFREEAERGYSIVRDRFDLILTVSEQMKEYLSTGDGRAHCMHNGYDADLFRLEPPGQEPPDLAAIPHPRMGYVGVIQERVDVELCRDIARRRKDWQMVFVGRVLNPAVTAAIENLPNVHMLGERTQSEIPRYLHGFDVCMIPHKVDRFTASMDPLKLYEYLGCGRPVVSTPVPPTERYANVVSIAADAEDFVLAIERELSCDGAADRQGRAASVQGQSWDAVLDTMMDMVLTAGKRIVQP